MSNIMSEISNVYLTHPYPANLDPIEDRKAIFRWINNHKKPEYKRLSRATIYQAILRNTAIVDRKILTHKRTALFTYILGGILLLNGILMLYYY